MTETATGPVPAATAGAAGAETAGARTGRAEDADGLVAASRRTLGAAGAATAGARTGRAEEADGLVAACRRTLGAAGAFLPERVPVITGLGGPFAALRAAADELVDHYHAPAPGVRRWLDRRLAEADPEVMAALRAADPATRAGVFGLLSILAHTYRWDTVPPDPARFSETVLPLPEGVRTPFAWLCDEIGVPHVGTVWSFLLCNWTLPGHEGEAYDAYSMPDGQPRLGCSWLRPPADADVENFHLAFTCFEARGGRAVTRAIDVVAAALRDDADGLAEALPALAEAIDAAAGQYVDRVRGAKVALEPWLDLVQPTFSWGLLGDDGRPLAGPGGMQLPTVHVLDAVLGVPGGSTIARAMHDSRRYMPAAHRELLAAIDRAAPAVRALVVASGRQDLKRAFNEAVRTLRRFRVAHRVQGARYLRAGGRDGAPRLSSGTGMAWRDDSSVPALAPADHFEREMLDRLVETTDALAAGAGEPSEVRAPETAFRFLDRAQLRALWRPATRVSAPAGRVIVEAGTRSEAMYLVVEGTAAVLAGAGTGDGPGTRIATLWPGELFGELSFLGAVPSRSVVADTDVLLDALPGDVVHAILHTDTALAAAFYRSLAVLVARRLNESASAEGWSVPAGPR